MNKYCMIVRDLIDYYGLEGLEGETLAYVKEHISACEECRNYIPNNKVKQLMTEDEALNKEDEKLLKKIRRLFYAGCIAVILFITWISVWSILWSR
ncbi:hypothetical protein PV797_03940 [Clostridiaceae bacterium M8S5]|nr:hypothetical protein PV797_03940 [Clostridiaceae bacterium M8S5]